MQTESATKPQADWDMSPYFSGVGLEDYADFKRALLDDLESLSGRAGAVVPGAVEPLRDVLLRLEDVERRMDHLSSYLGCTASADARDEATRAELAALSGQRAHLQKVYVRVQSLLRALSPESFQALCLLPEVQPVAHFVERVRRRALVTMAPELEELAADLSVDGISAWGRLYDQVSGNLSFRLEVPGKAVETLPVAMTRSLLESPDARVRQAAMVGSGAAWQSVSDTTAACLNAIAGTRLSLYRRRGVQHFLEPALFDAGIERRTLEAMWTAVRERQALVQRYLKVKARLLGQAKLGFEDLMAPLPQGGEASLSWERGVNLVLEAFGEAYPRLQAFAREAFDGRWIDHAPRAGKRPGGFCSSSSVLEQSRIFMTFNGAMGDVLTLAHELGHAFHNRVLRGCRHWARDYPMTLAETASIFAQQIVTDALLGAPGTSDAQRAFLLDQRLSDAQAFLLNIPMRFDFESALYEQRQKGELSVSRLKSLMVEAQRRNYGDALGEGREDPWFWCSKLHFYITEISFYNFPYTFGYLFSMGLFARAKREAARGGADFLLTYEDLLRRTGTAPAEALAHEVLGVDLRDPAFWHESIDLIEADLQSFEALVGAAS